MEQANRKMVPVIQSAGAARLGDPAFRPKARPGELVYVERVRQTGKQ